MAPKKDNTDLARETLEQVFSYASSVSTSLAVPAIVAGAFPVAAITAAAGSFLGLLGTKLWKNKDLANQQTECINKLLNEHNLTQSKLNNILKEYQIDAFETQMDLTTLLDRTQKLQSALDYINKRFEILQTNAAKDRYDIAVLAKITQEDLKSIKIDIKTLTTKLETQEINLAKDRYDNTTHHAKHTDLLNGLHDKVDQLQPPTSKPTSPIHNIPFPSLGTLFKGRSTDLSALTEQLKSNATSAITQAISGLGGIGKTRLAIEYAWHTFNNTTYSAALFVNCSQEQIDQKGSQTSQQAKTATAYDRLCVEMGPLAAADLLNIPDIDNTDPQAILSAILKALSQRDHYLIVFDNVDSPEMLTAVNHILPRLNNASTIITSRLTQFSPAVTPVTLQKLSPEASIEYLNQRTENSRRLQDNDPEKVKELATLLDGLPVALEHAAAYIIDQTISYETYLEDFKEVKIDVLSFDAHKANLADYPEPLLRTWSLSVQKLSSPAQAILTIAAFLAPDDIPESLFLNHSNIPLALSALIDQVSQEELEKLLNSESDPRTIRKAISECAKFSMITPSQSESTFTIHRLVQEVIRLHWPVELNELIISLILILFNLDQPDYERIIKTNYAWYKTMDSHLIALFSHIDHSWPKVKDIPTSITQNLTPQMNNLATLYQETYRLNEAEPLMICVIAITEKSYGENHPNVATALNNLASLYQETNRLNEAEPLMMQALKIAEKAYGKEHPNVATILNNLASLYQKTNRLNEAEPLMIRNLKINENIYGKEHPNVATALNNLASLYQETNRLNEAEPLMIRVIEILEKSYDENHPYLATTLNNLALLYRAINRLNEAEALMIQALKIDENAYGNEHPNVARDLNNLAQLYKVTNRLNEAEPLMFRALKIDENTYGKEHPNVATDLNNLASLYYTSNRFNDAEPLMIQALKIDESAYGKEHPNVARDLNNLASLYCDTKRLNDAEPLMKKMLTIYTNFTLTTGHPHPHLIGALNNYAILLIQIGKTTSQLRYEFSNIFQEMELSDNYINDLRKYIPSEYLPVTPVKRDRKRRVRKK